MKNIIRSLFSTTYLTNNSINYSFAIRKVYKLPKMNESN